MQEAIKLKLIYWLTFGDFNTQKSSWDIINANEVHLKAKSDNSREAAY